VPSSEPVLAVERLSAAWNGVPVVRSVSFTVAEGETFALLGPNGSGKTTLLRTIAGFERPTEGIVRLDGVDVRDLPPHRRRIGILFQDPALFPHRTVYENVAYAPLLQRRPLTEVRAEVDRLADLLSLRPLLDRSPEELSGGERQRVALARTLAARPRLVLLDEPFASVDVEIKAELRVEFREALRASRTAAIHVTHDREEGLFLGDRAGLLFDGVLEAVGPPEAIFSAPPSERAARFLGYNVVPSPSGPVAVHPDDLRIDADGGGPAYTVRASGPVGRWSLAVLEGRGGERLEVRTDELLPVGGRVHLCWERSVRIGR
jgi:ABC-type Fe3+/spermidine/putrescine transport system ATPase subunit